MPEAARATDSTWNAQPVGVLSLPVFIYRRQMKLAELSLFSWQRSRCINIRGAVNRTQKRYQTIVNIYIVV